MNFDTTAYLSNYLTTLLERCRSLTGLSDFATASPETVEDAVKQHFPAITRADYERFFRTETVSTTKSCILNAGSFSPVLDCFCC